MVTDEQYRKVLWHSRRGMLELDTLLVPFTQEIFPSLKEKDKQTYIQLIDHEDTDLFCWLMGHEQPELEFHTIIKQIKAHAAQHKQF